MSSLVTYRPSRPSPVNDDRWFDSLFQDWPRPAFATATATRRVDVYEAADGYHLEAELPGLIEKDFTVNVEHNLLTIASRQEQESEREEHGYVIRERRNGAFKRSFALPQDVDAEQISACFRDGLLTVTVPKSAKTQAKQITVTSGA